MSNWTDFRDNIIEAVKFDDVTEDMKNSFVKWLLETALPIAKESAENFTAQIKEQAKNESGWCKVRDLVVLPFIIDGGLWIIEKALNKTSV